MRLAITVPVTLEGTEVQAECQIDVDVTVNAVSIGKLKLEEGCNVDAESEVFKLLQSKRGEVLWKALNDAAIEWRFSKERDD
jgi:hypothetical protein